MDVYGRELAARLRARTLRSDVGRRSAEVFGIAPVGRAAARAAAADARFVRALRGARGGLLHLTGHHLARYGPLARSPYVVTVHDVIRHLDAWGGEPLIAPMNARDRALLAADRAGIRRAAACIAVSAHTAADVVARLGVPAERVHVVHEAVDHRRFRPVGGRPVEHPYVLFVGSEHPRKNLATLLRAFAALRREPGFEALKLVKVGAPGAPRDGFHLPARRLVGELGLGEHVVFAGRIPDDDLPRWYSAAACLALPSRGEGFGLPPLEAMACGCTVVVSNAGALPEVAGGAALLTDPGDAERLRAHLRAVLTRPELAQELRARGLARAAGFTWERTVEGTGAAYAAARASRRRRPAGGSSAAGGPRRRARARSERPSC
jgi:glycosyltransferase involved in cell wall biosynthesis